MSDGVETNSMKEVQIDVESRDVSSAVASNTKLTAVRGTRRRSCCCCCRCPQTRWGKRFCACGCGCCWLALVGVIAFNVFYFYPRTPQWEMVDLSFDEVHIRGLGIKGVGPADTSACPPYDACGIAAAKGCSTCPDSSYLNMGCLCQAPSGGTPAPPGTVIAADTSGCPWFDKCGAFHDNKGCSKCPDSSWINDGCTCRQPYSMDDFKSGWDRFWDLVTQQDPKPLALRLTAVVRATNPNNIGADTEPGSISVIFKDTVIGVAEVQPLHVKKRSNLTVVAKVNIHNLPNEVTMQMVQELMQNDGKIAITAEGVVAAHVLFMRVKTKVVCHVVSDVMDGQKLVEKDCTYTYGA